MEKRGLDNNQILGREAIKVKFYSKKDGYYKIKTVTPLQENAHYNEAFITETYHGGRNEQFIFGIADEGQWRDHDLSSAYTTAMSLIGTPDWDNITNLTTLDNVGPLDLSFFSVDFEFPKLYVFQLSLSARQMELSFLVRATRSAPLPNCILPRNSERY